MARSIFFTRPRFNIELAVSDSWPPLWYHEGKSGSRSYQLVGVNVCTADGFASFQLVAGPFVFCLTLRYGSK